VDIREEVVTVAIDVTAGPDAPDYLPDRPGQPKRPLWVRAARGRESDPAWVRPTLIGLLLATGLLYIWGLGSSGWANSFYSAAVQAGTKSWKAFFFGSSDASNFITVDKPPMSLWVMEISARIFGVNAWSILVPQALEGVAAVGVLYLAVRRWFSPAAALLAGAALALTPVAVLMFRFNNPDALLTLLLTLGAYAIVRAVESGRTAWLVAAAALVGCGFITKMLQAFLVVPAFALVYLIAGPPRLGRRLWQLLLAGVALLVASGWWVAVVQLTPAADRPYIGGSQHNSLLELIFGYNGLGRLNGNETGSVVGGAVGGAGGAGGGATGGLWGPTGLFRLFWSDMGGQVSWLIPAALLFAGGMLWLTRRMPRTDRLRAAAMLWGGWLVVSGLVFSFAAGIIHPYYTVALAPAIGALVGIGSVIMWRARGFWSARIVLAAAIVATSVWSVVLLNRTPDWMAWLRPLILIVGFGAAAAVLLGRRLTGRAAAVTALAGVLAALAGPAAYALDTAATAHSGAIPSAGPSAIGTLGAPGGQRRFGAFGGQGGTGQFGGAPGFGGQTGTRGGFGGGGGAGGGAAGNRGAAGGLLNGSTPGGAITKLLQTDASRYTWAAAAVGSNTASGYQLATGDPVMAIGGFNGTDPAPTLAQFEQYVAAGRIHYFIASGGGFGGGQGGAGGQGGSGDASQITSWVESNFSATTVDGVTVYDLTTSTGSGT
jgi:4-amino-4-deoxy-L-arabinose transferase-like glycosyltransferase